MPAQSPVLHAPLVPWVPVEEPANGAYRLASDLATLVGLHQNRLSLLALRLCDLNRHGDGDQASLDCCDQPLLASFEECDDVAHPASRAPNLFGDLGIAVATLGEIADLGHKRSEERRVGTECVSTCRSRWWPCHYKHKKNINITETTNTSNIARY